jgi:hypothetical protein
MRLPPALRCAPFGPTPPSRLARLAVVLLASLLGASVPLSAQRDSLATVRGVVRTADRVPVDEVLVRLLRDSTLVAESRTVRTGGFTLPRIAPGAYTLDVRRIGYESRRLPIAVERPGVLAFDVSVVPLPVPPLAVSADATWRGVIGVVGDYDTMDPIAGVRVRPLGGGDSVRTDASGRFAVPVPAGGTGALLVERDGYAPRLASFTLREEERGEVVVLLDASARARTDGWVWKDLAQRHAWSTPRAVRVARAELLATGAHNLLVALENAPTVQQSALVFSRGVCLYVNGQPRPGFPLDAIVTERVEYVEGYAIRGDLSRTLQLRWPPNQACGAAGGDLTVRRAIESGQGIQFAVVWLR